MNKRINNYPRHPSIRGEFGFHLYNHMVNNKDVYLLVGDLGYKLFDPHFEDFPDRCINCGASEGAMMDIAVGLAMSGRIPFIYSITPFLLWRPAETIRLYLDHESIPVKLIGSGRDADYHVDGFSHDATDANKFLMMFPNILTLWPEDKEQIEALVGFMVFNERPTFISLRR